MGTIPSGFRNLLAITLLLATVVFAAKSRDWKDAKLTNISRGDTGQAVIVPLGTGLYGGRIYQTDYTFKTPDLVIVTVTRGRKALNLTINKATKIAIENQKLYVVDDGGKELKLNIVGKRAK